MSGDLPDISDGAIVENAWLVYEMVRTTAEYKNGRARRRDGRPGREWTGSINKIMVTLWPALSDRYLAEKAEADGAKIALNRYLRDSRNLVCLRSGGVTHPSTWWVSDNWSPVTVRKAASEPDVVDDPAIADFNVTFAEKTPSDVFDVQVSEPAQLQSETVTQSPNNEEEMKIYPCRICEKTFHGSAHRAGHERSHGVRYNADGTTTSFDPAHLNRSYTSAELYRIILEVAVTPKDAEGWTVGDLTEALQAKDPTISKAAWRAAIDEVASGPYNGRQLVQHKEPIAGTHNQGRTARYFLERVQATPADMPTKAPGKASETATLIQENLDERTEQATGAVVTSDVLTHAANIRALLHDLDRLAKLEAENKKLQDGLKASSAKNYELVERLRKVTAERDELKSKLDALKSVFGTAFSN